MLMRFSALLVLLGLFFTAGCSQNSGPAFYPVTGKVTLDGAPLPTATIVLRDPAGQEKTCIAKVVDGLITGEATAGEKIVEVTATRIAAGKTVAAADGSGTDQAIEQYIPEKYNMKSDLKVTIGNQQPNELTLELSSK